MLIKLATDLEIMCYAIYRIFTTLCTIHKSHDQYNLITCASSM